MPFFLPGLSKIARAAERILVVVIAAILFSLVLIVLWGVFTRFILDSSSLWTEEISRYLLIWLTMLGTAAASARCEHLGVDYFVNLLDKDARWLLALTTEFIVLTFSAAVLTYGGWVLVSETLQSGQTTPALGVKMGLVYLAVPIGGVGMILFSLERIVLLICSDSSHDDAVATGQPAKVSSLPLE